MFSHAGLLKVKEALGAFRTEIVDVTADDAQVP
jgi:hypothetical protein